MILLSKITANIAELYSNTTTTIITTEIAMIAITNQVYELRCETATIEWRRSQVLELSSEGYNQREIAQKLQIDKICS